MYETARRRRAGFHLGRYFFLCFFTEAVSINFYDKPAASADDLNAGKIPYGMSGIAA
jgi:hypothetical protein